MNEQEWETMEVLENETVSEPTPWQRSTKRVIAGIALTGITLNFWCLNYILPAIGITLLLLGFRALRREDPWFRRCFVLTVLRAAYFFPSLILNTTILQSAVYASSAGWALAAVNLVLAFATCFCLWRAFLSVQRKADLPPRARSAAALVVWYVLMTLLSLVGYIGLILPAALLIGYIVILRKLYKLAGSLDEVATQPAPGKGSDLRLVLSLVAFLLVGSVCGYAFGDSYPMTWTPLDPAEAQGNEDLRAHLLDLGFPAYVLDDLRPEDLAACAGASHVVVQVEDHPRGSDRPDAKDLRLTGVGVRLPGETDRWMLFHHFLWTTPPDFYGTEAIQLWPAYRDNLMYWRPAGEVTGRLLCQQEGETLTADYYFLGEQTYTASTPFWGDQTTTDTLAAFSLPRDSTQQRGYLAYPMESAQGDTLITSWVTYAHQAHPLQYPVVTAMESFTKAFFYSGPFRTVQDALQFYPTEEGAEPIN